MGIKHTLFSMLTLFFITTAGAASVAAGLFAIDQKDQNSVLQQQQREQSQQLSELTELLDKKGISVALWEENQKLHGDVTGLQEYAKSLNGNRQRLNRTIREKETTIDEMRAVIQDLRAEKDTLWEDLEQSEQARFALGWIEGRDRLLQDKCAGKRIKSRRTDCEEQYTERYSQHKSKALVCFAELDFRIDFRSREDIATYPIDDDTYIVLCDYSLGDG